MDISVPPVGHNHRQQGRGMGKFLFKQRANHEISLGSVEDGVYSEKETKGMYLL